MTKRAIVARIQLGTVDQIVVSIDGDCVDLHRDINGFGVFLVTGEGFAIPRERIGELIKQLEKALSMPEMESVPP